VPLPVSSTPDSSNDSDLIDDLLAQVDARDQVQQMEAAKVLSEVENKDLLNNKQKTKQDNKARFKAREARKAEKLAASYGPDDKEADARFEREAKEEEKVMRSVCNDLNLEMYEIQPDGHCLYSAVADQLVLLGILPPGSSYRTTRAAAASFMRKNPEEFRPFLPCVDGEDGIGATQDTGLMSQLDYERYCAAVRDTGVWGGEPEIKALSRTYRVPIHVYQTGNPPVVEHIPFPEAPPDPKAPVVRISYHRRMYGLGEHYNSLRPRQSKFAILKSAFS
jgi:OTU domain-containing protein 6